MFMLARNVMANNNPVLQRHTAKMTFLCIVISLKIVLQRQKMVSCFIFELLCNWINMRLSKNLLYSSWKICYNSHGIWPISISMNRCGVNKLVILLCLVDLLCNASANALFALQLLMNLKLVFSKNGHRIQTCNFSLVSCREMNNDA